MLRNLRQRAKRRIPKEPYPELPQVSDLVSKRHQSNNYPKRKYKYVVPTMFFALILMYQYIIPLLFGEHPLHGGYIGMLIDIRIRKYLWNRKLKAATKEALELGLAIPTPTSSSSSRAKTKNVPHAIVLEMIHRNDRKKELLRKFQSAEYNNNMHPVIVVRKKDLWSRPIARTTGLTPLDMDESDMDAYMNALGNDNGNENGNGNGVYKRISDAYFRIQREMRGEFFFVAFLNRYGGIYTSPFCNHDDHLELQQLRESLDQHQTKGEGWARIKDGSLQSLIVPPNHEYITCIQDIGISESENLTQSGKSLFQMIVNQITASKDDSNGYIELSEGCPTVHNSAIGSNVSEIGYQYRNANQNIPVKNISVQISTKNEPTPHYIHKTTVDQLLSNRSRFCTNMWMWPCHRCLKSAFHGSYAKCSFLCGSCSKVMYEKRKEIGHGGDDEIVTVSVDVNGFQADGTSQMIPRVIHQTWFEEITLSDYPDLFRLQQSWKNTGWEYKLYTDSTARQYIEDYFPKHFLQAYDALIPGAYKADLFRYMVLMREGGIYADVDVMLDASLDTFITPTMSLFTPRDAVAEYAEGQYCLWNGLIGAAPGHQVMIRAVERLVNLILNRADALDLEKQVAEKTGINTETWKIRAVQELLLSGPCALGIAMNEAIGRDLVARFDLGWIESSDIPGDIMILMVSNILVFYDSFTRLIYFLNQPLFSKIKKTWVLCDSRMWKEI